MIGILLTASLVSGALVTVPGVCGEVVVPAGEIVRGEIGQKLDDFLQGMTKRGFSGSALVSRDGVISLKKGFGLADRERSLANTSETRFNIASVSKTFTAAVILDFEEEGVLGTHDRVGEHLGAFPEGKSAATIHNLLTHTAGMAIRGTNLQYDSREDFVESMKRAEIESLPGQKFRYTNAGYTLLAAIVEEVSGNKFEAVLQERLFDPSCMTATKYVWEINSQDVPLAIGYRGDDVEDLLPSPPEENVWGNRGPGSFATTVGDLYKWVRALEADVILGPAAKRRMFTAYVGDEGYGWHVEETENGLLVRRGGGLPGYESSLRWYIDENVVIVVAINNDLGLRVPIAKGIENVVFDSE